MREKGASAFFSSTSSSSYSDPLLPKHPLLEDGLLLGKELVEKFGLLPEVATEVVEELLRRAAKL
jgi:hypothetical protein